MLELYQFERCPFSARVRSQLSEWEVDYVLRNVPEEPARRKRLFQVTGQTAVPTLVDSARHIVIAGDDAQIIDYVGRHYAGRHPTSRPVPPYNLSDTDPQAPKGYD